MDKLLDGSYGVGMHECDETVQYFVGHECKGPDERPLVPREVLRPRGISPFSESIGKLELVSAHVEWGHLLLSFGASGGVHFVLEHFVDEGRVAKITALRWIAGIAALAARRVCVCLGVRGRECVRSQREVPELSTHACARYHIRP